MLKVGEWADLVINDRAGHPVATVELKNRQALTREVAVQLRRSLLAHLAVAPGTYLLLLSQDVGYLWSDKQNSDWLAPPSREFPMQAVISRYTHEDHSSERLREAEFASIVFRWLQSLTQLEDDDAARAGTPDQAANLAMTRSSNARAGFC